MSSFPFECTEAGTFYIIKSEGEEDKKIQFASRIEVKAAMRNHDSEDWSQLIEITDPDKKVHQWIMPRSLLAGDVSAVAQDRSGGTMAPRHLFSRTEFFNQ